MKPFHSLVALCLGLLIAGCGPKKDRLNLLIWSEYIDPSLISQFEAEHNCQVVVDLFEDPESMIAKLAAGGTATYDIVVPSDTTLPAMVHQGLLSPLRAENIPNLRNLDPQFTNAPFDPGNRYGAPVDWGTTGVYYRKSKGAPMEVSWASFFDASRQTGAFLLIEDARACIGAALRYRGYSVNTTNSAELAVARDVLIEAKKRSLGFEGGTGCKNRVLSKGAAIAMAYSGDAMRGIKEDSETSYFIPKEGTQIFVDLLSVPSHAPHRDLAEKFINFMLDAKISAKFANLSGSAVPNRAALEFVDPAILSNPLIYPPKETMDRLEYIRDLGEANKLYDEVWTVIKSK